MNARLLLLLPLSLAACSRTWPAGGAVDLTTALEDGQARAGQIADDSALIGGVSADGQIGDYKLYNSKASFIVQGVRDGDFYISYGGAIIDADAARGADEPGRDTLDEQGVMIGLGRLIEPDQIAVLSAGSGGLPAVVRVTGHGAPMKIITGSLESETIVPDRDCTIVTDYILEADSHLVRIESTLTWHDEATAVQIGDLAMVSNDVARGWTPGRGFDEDGSATGDWVGATAHQDQVALALFSDGAPWSNSSLQDILSSVGSFLAGFGDSQTLEDGDNYTWTRWLGVGPDLATLSGDWLGARGVATETLGGTVTAAGAPVAGARVHVLGADGLPSTLARTDADGAWSARVPAGGSWSAVATGRGTGDVVDLPSGVGWTSPYSGDAAAAVTMLSLTGGAPEHSFATGNGIGPTSAASAETALTLNQAGTLHITVADGGPAVVRVGFADSDPVTADAALVSGRPDGLYAHVFIRDGDIDLPIEPGSYTVVVHRGARSEPWVETVEVAAGGETSISATITTAWTLPGVLAVDPHSHGSPSGDGGLPMEERLVVHAANGLDAHFGTDHDHVADYRPLLAPLGLDGRMTSIVADEVSPVLRGHFNVYPLEPDRTKTNHGAWEWWEETLSTPDLFGKMREMLAGNGVGDGIVQSNHPVGSSGMWTNADYDMTTGEIGAPDHWSSDFDTVEVLNDGEHAEYVPMYWDLISRGLTAVPVGVSDSHSHRGGAGQNMTWLHAGVDTGPELSPALLVSALKSGATVPSTGPMIVATVDGTWAPGTTLTGNPTLKVEIYTASWMPVDLVELVANTTVVGTWSLAGQDDPGDDTGADSGSQDSGSQDSGSQDSGSQDSGGKDSGGKDSGGRGAGPRYVLDLPLDASSDAVYTVVVSGTAAMAPVYPSALPWAMTAPIRLDVAGDGWTAPMSAPFEAR